LILIVTTADHADTHQELPAEDANARVVSYDELASSKKLADATYVFTDLDRLPTWFVLKAALLYRNLKSRGLTVLNDPAKVLGRYGVLRALHRSGFNQFNAYRVEERVMPQRWPVFLRMEGAHSMPLSPLLQNRQQLATAVRRAVSEGFPLTAMLIVEYAGEPAWPGVFRRLSVFKIGDRLIGCPCAHDDNWIVKYGKRGVAPPEAYEEEYAIVESNPFGEAVRPAFEQAGIDYGRVDFGLVQGRPQIFEINTNPQLHLRPDPSPIARRNDSMELFRRNYLEAVMELDRSPSLESQTA
jgi:hypothetical protein